MMSVLAVVIGPIVSKYHDPARAEFGNNIAQTARMRHTLEKFDRKFMAAWESEGEENSPVLSYIRDRRFTITGAALFFQRNLPQGEKPHALGLALGAAGDG